MLISIHQWRMKTVKSTFLTLCIVLSSQGSFGQIYEVDTSFRTNTGINSCIKVFQLSDGNLLISNSQNPPFKTSANGIPDPTFALNPSIEPLDFNIFKEYLDGKILWAYRTATGGEVKRLNPDGSLDSTLDDIHLNTAAIDLSILPDSSFLVLGQFDNVNGSSVNGLIRFNHNGILDTVFDFDRPDVFSPKVMEAQPDGKILVGGGFYTFLTDSTSDHYGLFRLNSNGVIDSTFIPQIVGDVNDVETLPNSKILIAGDFLHEASGMVDVVLLHPNGDVDEEFQCEAWSRHAMMVKTDSSGKVWVGGQVWGSDQYDNLALVRLNSDGSLDNSFDNGRGFRREDIIHSQPIPTVSNVVLQTDGSFVATGVFVMAQGEGSVCYARLKVGGYASVHELDFTFTIYPNPATSNITIQSKTPLAQVWVSDLAGRRVLPALYSSTLRVPQGDTSGYANIDVSALPSGIYLVGAITEDGRRSVQKVVVE